MIDDEKPSEIISAFGMFAEGNDEIDFNEMENQLKELSKNSEQNILEKSDFLS